MKSRYINYGAIPVNEYKKSREAMEALKALNDNRAEQKSAPAHRIARIKRSGWKHSWKANGWRADLASIQGEQMSEEGNCYVHKK